MQHKILLKFAKSCTNHSTYFKNVRKQSVNIYKQIFNLKPDHLLMGASGEQYESLVIMFHNTSESILLSF